MVLAPPKHHICLIRYIPFKIDVGVHYLESLTVWFETDTSFLKLLSLPTPRGSISMSSRVHQRRFFQPFFLEIQKKFIMLIKEVSNFYCIIHKVPSRNTQADHSKILKESLCLKWIVPILLYLIGYLHIQSWSNDYKWLLNKPYVNEVTLRGQNPPLKCCYPLDFLYTFLNVLIFQCWKFGVYRSKNCKVTSHQTLRMIRLRANLKSCRLVWVWQGPGDRLFYWDLQLWQLEAL